MVQMWNVKEQSLFLQLRLFQPNSVNFQPVTTHRLAQERSAKDNIRPSATIHYPSLGLHMIMTVTS